MNWVRHEDYSIFRLININLHSQLLDPISTLLSYSGLGVSLTLFAFSLAFWKTTRPLVIPLLATLILSGFVISDLVLKGHPQRLRPSNLPFAIREEHHLIASFPSGHSCVAFGTAFTILLLMWDTPGRKWGWAALVWATLVGLSRIYRGVHWPTDVIAGALVGLFSACIITVITRAVEGEPESPKKRTSPKKSAGKKRKTSRGS